MIQPAIDGGAFHRPEIAYILDNADGSPVALRITTQATDIPGIEIPAIGAAADAARYLSQILGKRQHQPVPVLQQMKHRPPG